MFVMMTILTFSCVIGDMIAAATTISETSPTTFSPTKATRSPIDFTPTNSPRIFSPTTPSSPTKATRSPIDFTSAPTTPTKATRSPIESTFYPTNSTSTPYPSFKPAMPPLTNQSLSNPYNANVKSIKCSGSQTCYVDNLTSQVKCNRYENEGIIKSGMGNDVPFINLGINRNVIDLDAGDFFNCAVLDNSKVKCWGFNANIQTWGSFIIILIMKKFHYQHLLEMEMILGIWVIIYHI
jgi:hypothetical protein